MNPSGRDPASDKPNPFGAAQRPADARNPAQERRAEAGGSESRAPGGQPDQFLTPAPSVSLPQGGGAIRGIGETFQANAATGTAGLSVPIAVSPSPRGLSPQLSLSYDSGSGNGPFGMGWNLSIPSIRRKTDRGLPRYRDTWDGQDESDVYQLAGSEDLVPWMTGGAPVTRLVTEGSATFKVVRYRPRIEGAFTRIERWTDQSSGVAHWRTHAGDNSRRVFGRTATARIADADDPMRVFAWLLEEVYDERGNTMLFTYKVEDRANVDASKPAERARGLTGHKTSYAHVKTIEYANKVMNSTTGGFHFRLVFDYGEHTATPPTSAEDVSWPVREDPFSSFRAGFDHRCYRLCARVLMFHDFAELGAGWTLVRSTEFTYDEQPHCTKLLSVTHRGYEKSGSTWTDQAMPPVDFTYTEAELGEEIQFVTGVDDLPRALDTAQYQWVDLDGEGLTGLLTKQGGGWFYKRNEGQGALGPMRRLGTRPAASLRGSRLVDLGGDGQLDLVQVARPPKGFYERDLDGGWAPFRAFKHVPNVNLEDPNIRMIDLDGDGFADVVVADDEVFRWYPSEAKDGYGHAEQRGKSTDEDDGPTLVFANEAEHIFLADMTGDGLTDLVRIRRTSVEYWPNRGYGQFGARVIMGNVPTFDRIGQFEPSRIRLADVDGSGPTDVIYLAADGVRLYINQSGNRLADVARLDGFPPIHNVAQVSIADVLGDGTACLVWSSPLMTGAAAPLRYVRLMAGGKPHLLKTITNNLGRVTTLSYTPSTEFYAADRRAGRPWATRLAFPVQCLSKVAVEDGTTGWRFVSTYTFHHGYFDGPEREFRGFGLVIQRDTESVTDFKDASNGDVAHHLDPVVTKTWFHTGAWRQQQRLTDVFAAEAWAGDPSAGALPQPSVPEGLNPQEHREAYRALRGSPLRVEVFAEDGGSDATKPFSVTSTTYTVASVQPKAGQRHGVFQLLPSETRSSQYERNAADPRVVHTLVLETDSYGQVLKSASVGYKRRAAQITAASPPTPVDTEQARTHVTVTTAAFIHDDATDLRYHLSVPYETETFELTGVDADDTAPFTAVSLLSSFSGASEIAYETAPTTGAQKRRLARTRIRYWNDALSGELALGVLGERALPRQQYQQVYTAGLIGTTGPWGDLGTALGTTYAAPSTSDLTAAKYTLEDSVWWRPSGVTSLLPGQFYLPDDHTDPFGNLTAVTYDTHGLFVHTVTDAVGNVVTASHDYRVLSPWQLQDPNGAKQQVAFDALGRVTKLAVLGTASEGDTLSAPTAQFTYEMDRWHTSSLPNRVKAEQRKQHGVAGFHEQYAYSDGGGEVVMTKVQAEPGDAPERDGAGDLVFDGAGELQFAHADPRWIGTGRTIVDNKGNPIKQFEPFFSDTHEFEDDDDLVEWGVTPILHYDPLGRNIRVDLPDGTYSTVNFDPWRMESADAGDNVVGTSWLSDRLALASGDPDRRAAELSRDLYAATPSVAHMDALGRTIVTVESNKTALATPTPPPYTSTAATYQTTLVLDVQGFVRTVQGEKGRAASTPYVDQAEQYDMIGRPMRSASSDAGLTWSFVGVDDQPLQVWREGPVCVHSEYDALRRPTALKVQEGTGVSTTRTHEKLQYGEAAGAPTGTGEYHRGRVWKTWDGAGLVTVEHYDFKGNPIDVTRAVISRAQVGTNVHWDAGTPPTLESTTFSMQGTFDALDRPLTQTAPDGSVTKLTYNTAGLLETVKVAVRGRTTDKAFVDDIDYDEKGRRTLIAYGNDTETSYDYDPLTFRLTRLKTTKTSDGTLVQDLTYYYDAVGNIVEVQDAAQQTKFFQNALVSPTQTFEYDALYRLTRATGRQKVGLSGVPDQTFAKYSNPATFAADSAETMAAYERRYAYDGVGNLTEMKQVGSWTRSYHYAADSNQLTENKDASATSLGTFGHNVRGAMTSMPHLNSVGTSGGGTGLSTPIVRDFLDQISDLALHTGTNTAHYQYDPTRERVRKVIRKGVTEERIYLGSWELWRKFDGSGTLTDERETLHVMDGEKRLAMIETLTMSGGTATFTPPAKPSFDTRWQYGNHLGSACAELDDSANLITYEEFFPYGSTSWWSEKNASPVSQKRYRYIGKERDEETGLNYHSARYLAPWLGRWCSSDPAGMVDGVGRYSYGGNSPIKLSDRTGLSKNDFDFPSFRDQMARETESRRRQYPQDGPSAEERAAFDSGAEVGRSQGAFVAKLHWFLSHVTHDYGGGSPWERMSDEDRADLIRGIGVEAANVAQSDPNARSQSSEWYDRGLEHGYRSAYDAASWRYGAEDTFWEGLKLVPLLFAAKLNRVKVPGPGPFGAAAIQSISREKLTAGVVAALAEAQGARVVAAADLPAAVGKVTGEAAKRRVLLGPYFQSGIISGGEDIPAVGNVGLQALRSVQARVGGTILNGLPGEMSALRPAIDAADDIVFNVSRSGLARNPLTAEELIYVLSKPELAKKTTFVFDLTF